MVNIRAELLTLLVAATKQMVRSGITRRNVLPRHCMSALENPPRAHVEDLITLRVYGLKVGVVAKTRTLSAKLEDIFEALQALFSMQAFDSAAPRIQKLSGAD